MKSKAETKMLIAELEAVPSPSPEPKMAAGWQGPMGDTLLEAMLEAVATLELDGTICYVNSEFEKGTGWKREEVIGKKIFDIGLLPEEECQRIESEIIPKIMAQGSVRNFETIAIRKTGAGFPVLMSWTLLKDNDGKPANIITMARDITDRKKAEELHKSLFEFSPVGIATIDLKGKLTACNPAMLSIGNSYSKDEIVGKYFWKTPALRAKDGPKYLQMLKSLLAGKKVKPFESFFYHKDGSPGWAELSVSQLRVGDKLVGAMCTMKDITEQKRSGEALRESERKFKSLAEESPNMIFINQGGRVVYANKTSQDMMGYTREEFYSADFNFMTLIAPEHQEKVKTAFQRHMRGEEIPPYEYALVSKDGRITEALITTKLIEYEGKSALLGIVADITEHKQTEEKLKHAAHEWRTTFDTISDLVFILDRNYRFVRANKAFARAFGKEPKEIIGKACYEVVHGASEPPPYCPNITVLKTRKAATTEYYELRSGIYLQATSWPILDDKGEVATTINVARDITERKKDEVALQKSELNFRNSIDNSPLGVSIITRDSRLVYANRTFLNLYGYNSVDELKSVPISKRYTPASYKKRLERKEMVKRALPIPKSYETSIIRKDGEIRNLQVTWENVSWDGQPRVQVLYQDVTERRRLQEQLIITDRLASVGELAAGVAHELNNPLTGLIGFSQLLLEKDIPEDIRDDVDIIYREAQRSSEVVKNLLTFARKHVPQKLMLNLNDSIEKVLQLRAYEQKVNNINVATRLDPDLPQAMGDEFQLQQVFLNIILNAEFSMIEARRGGTLTVTTEKVKDTVRASIADDGPGIDKQAIGHLFDPFFTTKEVGKGTGLGLSICHGIINEHGGRIYADSAPGKGATFIVEIPLHKQPEKGKGS
jgi:PAS domain S-box-containing protein